MFRADRKKVINMETERLRLTPWSTKDAEALFAYASNEAVGPPAGWKPHESVGESTEIIRTIFMKNLVWKICLKETGQIIGSVGLEPDKRRDGIRSKEMGYSLGYDYWGNGYMTEAATKVKEYAFEELDLEVLAIQTGPENLRSQSIIKKLGFVYEGKLRKAYKVYTGFDRDVLVYSITRDEWLQK